MCIFLLLSTDIISSTLTEIHEKNQNWKKGQKYKEF